MKNLGSSENGLTDEEAADRLSKYGRNTIQSGDRPSGLILFFNQFKSPITLILIGAVILSFSLKEHTDALIILAIVLTSGLLSFLNEKKSSDAIRKLMEMISVRITAIRSSAEKEIPIEEIVPGDLIRVKAGDVIPGDCLLVRSKDLFANEATLTGESYPAEKCTGVVAADSPLAKQTNTLFMGSHVSSGEARALVVNTGASTIFGKLSQRLKTGSPETDFERGIRRFGYLLLEVTLILVILIFAINVYFHRPVLEAFLFSLAIAVGLTPQLLPAIISVNLSHGARAMCKKQVIVRKLNSIENFGSMNVLCSDKTGTITEGIVNLHAMLDCHGVQSEKTFRYAYLNAMMESGFVNPIDEAIRKAGKFDISEYKKLDEVPYDFSRKCLSILVAYAGENIMIAKGAFPSLLPLCTALENADNQPANLDEAAKAGLKKRFDELSGQGYRILGIAYKKIEGTVIDRTMEQGMTFLGFMVLDDPPKKDILNTLKSLQTLGISFRVITGDNAVVAAAVSRQIGLQNPNMLTGPEMKNISEEALPARVANVTVFAEIEPTQKERIIRALKRSGSVVGYLGDGINDAPALHAADVGISVDSAAEVAKSVADIVLLEKDLDVLIAGVEEGRRTFTNTLKYIFMASSANFGNMFTMAGASLFLPFLPLLPKQILFLNLLTDFPEMAIASDNVDEEMVRKPRRWNIRMIRNFMIVFGVISSVFDYATFFVLLYLLHASQDQFRTGWFIESLTSAALIALAVRTRRPFLKSRPGKYLAVATISVAILALVIPLTPLGSLLGFTPLPLFFYGMVLLIVLCYLVAVEIAKHYFYKAPGGSSRSQSVPVSAQQNQ